MKAAERAKHAVLEALATGEFPVGEELPAEARLAERFGVSRLTIRETIGSLAASGVLEVQQGRRNRIAPVSRWSVLDPEIVAVHARLEGDTSILVQDLMESRRVLEVGMTRLAALRITDEELSALDEQIQLMRDNLDSADAVKASALADIRFHEIILEAAHNRFLIEAFRTLAQMLLRVRLETSRTRQVRLDALGWHQQILAALRTHDEEAAARAMAAHLDQTVAAAQRISLV
ncbi:FCD domain-containing protein [Luteococcus sp. H138]|uniref:FadR/GntR family transcriptional regulator n=1 Tax=unclassified Luteococcus TaxID=2639923 RepID=UPI00313A865E